MNDETYNGIDPSGYNYGKAPKGWHPFWSKVGSILSTVFKATVGSNSGTPSVTVDTNDNEVTFNFDGIKGEKGDKGEKGEKGDNGLIPTDYVKDISITNTNGVYDVKVTGGDGSTSDSQIDVPNVDNLIAEINDSIVENTANNYDFHTFKETENNGTQNDVSKFYIARNQLTSIVSSIKNKLYTVTKKYVNQAGVESEEELTFNLLSMDSYQNRSYSDIFSSYKLDLSTSMVAITIYEIYNDYEYYSNFVVPFLANSNISIINIDTGWNQIYGKLYFEQDGNIKLDVFTYNPQINLDNLKLTITSFKQVKLTELVEESE